ncbi:MAG: hypothetical protein R3F34_01895 [Planctomycetota bacterium]
MTPGHTDELARLTGAFRRRCYAAAFVGGAVRALAVALAIAGCATLVARIGLRIDDGRAFLGWLALLAVVPYAAVRARRSVPSAAAAAAWIDARTGGSGALVTRFEAR